MFGHSPAQCSHETIVTGRHGMESQRRTVPSLSALFALEKDIITNSTSIIPPCQPVTFSAADSRCAVNYDWSDDAARPCI